MGAMAFGGGSAWAMPVTTGTAPFEVDWSCSSTLCATNNQTPPAGVTLTGIAAFSNPVFTTEGSGLVDLSIDVTISNTTAQGSLSTADWQSIRLTSWGFDTDPDAGGGSTSGALVFQNVLLNKTFPGGFMQVDVCLVGGTNCSGGSNGGLAPVGSGASQPSSDAFILNLTGFPTGTTSVDFGTEVAGATELFDVKYQTGLGNGGSFEFQNQPCVTGSSGCGDPPTNAPEPTSMTLLGSGLVLLGWFARRRIALGGTAAA
jgi:hypothetical protein